MLEKPDLQDELILTRLNDAYGLYATHLIFLPLGADVNTAVFKVDSQQGTAFFLKLRKGGFEEITVTVPHYLHSQGNQAIIPPLAAVEGRLWAWLEEYAMILYPFIAGKNGYEVALSDRQWRDFGTALKEVHKVQLPPELSGLIPHETFTLRWRDIVRTFQVKVETAVFTEPVAKKTAGLMKARRESIGYMLARADQLGRELQNRALEKVLCHSDMHAGNLLLGANDTLYIVDWDNPTFAPIERDLCQIGGCVSWNKESQTALFFQGYGQTMIDRRALAYYRYERIIQDIAAYCEQLLLTDAGGEDREQSFIYFAGQFLPNHEIDIAINSDR